LLQACQVLAFGSGFAIVLRLYRLRSHAPVISLTLTFERRIIESCHRITERDHKRPAAATVVTKTYWDPGRDPRIEMFRNAVSVGLMLVLLSDTER
jgi:hypothetical protein